MLLEFELVVLLAMVGTLLVCTLGFKLPLSVSVFLGAIAGALVSGEGIPLRHLFEGGFAVIDVAILMVCAMIFVNVAMEVGIFEAIGAKLIRAFYRHPVLLCIVMMMLLLFPGMITGSANVSVLSIGPIILPVLLLMGMSAGEAGAFITIGAVLSLPAPPVNIPAMLIANNVEVPYQGFTGPLLFMTLIPAVLGGLYLCRRCFKKKLTLEEISERMDLEADRRYGWTLYLPLLFVVVALIVVRMLPQYIPDPGTSLILLVGAVLGCFVGKRCNLLEVSQKATRTGISVAGKIMAIGMFMQIMSLTGVRGYVVANCTLLPIPLLLAAACIIVPMFGGISVYGSSMMLSAAVVMSVLTGDLVVISAALSILASLGELMPPAALSANYASGIVGVPYGGIVRHCVVPVGIILVTCYICMLFSKQFAFLVWG